MVLELPLDVTDVRHRIIDSDRWSKPRGIVVDSFNRFSFFIVHAVVAIDEYDHKSLQIFRNWEQTEIMKDVIGLRGLTSIKLRLFLGFSQSFSVY